MPGVLTSWVLFPLVLTALCVGWGWLLASALRMRVPGVLVPGLGMAGIVIAGQFLTYANATAEMATPVIAALGGAGLVVGVVWRRGRPPGWAVAAAAATFAVYAAPIVLSGEATFAGFIKLDDTATWMALTDRIMEHGRDLEGLAPSTYERTLDINLGDGYPVGVFVPLGVGAALVGEDVAWVVQPYMAFWVALLALALYALGRVAVTGPRARAAVAFVSAQPALLFGYYLWGGIKEVAAIALIAATVALLPLAVRRGPVRAVVPAALATGALVGVLSGGGVVWLGPALLAAAVLAVRRLGPRTALGRGALFAVVAGLASVPILAAGGFLPPTSSPLTESTAIGNLAEPLDPFQVSGIWPAGDFRFDPGEVWLAYALAIGVSAAALGGLLVAWHRRSWWVPGFVVGTLAAALAIALTGSPWVEGKALATASAVIPFAALVAAAALWGAGRRLAGGLLAVLVAGGVLWSNALAYRDVSLAPRERLAELERIGELTAGEGPALMTEYNPYGVRHFLRDAEPEGVSELRRRTIPLADGDTVPKGDSADTDELDPDGLLVYRSLVLRRSPVRSRPPSPYRLEWAGHYYELWQRPEGAVPQVERLGLGTDRNPGGVPDCADVLALARGIGPGGGLTGARVGEPLVLSLAYDKEATAHPRRPGRYSAWLPGSIRGEATLFAGGEEIGSDRHELNHEGGYVEMGDVDLPAGRTELRLELGGADLHPGSGGVQPVVSPLVLAPEAHPVPVVGVRARAARELCGRRWDWIEAARATR